MGYGVKQRIHILGASGSGTTTIAGLVCDALGYKHFDTDSYFWKPTEEPFTEIRPKEERLELMTRDLTDYEQWVLSGSLDGWGNPLLPLFDMVVFVYVPTDVRVERLKKREFNRYGDAVLPNGKRHESTREFIEWAAEYDFGTREGRNLPRHESWLENLKNPVLRIVNDNLDESVRMVIKAIEE